MATRSRPAEALGQSEAFLEFQERLSSAARADRPVLIIGERGTGKELASGRLHYLSARWQGPFVPLNCAALAASLLDAELFGHEAGAFTGAAQRRKGRFEVADRGTLFLDEIANLSLPAQEKILRAVEYGEFERVGGTVPVRVDVRVIGATNADLPGRAAAGSFKRDLLDRLSFEVLTLPPLREREGDVPLLAAHFAARMAVELGLAGVPEFTERAMDELDAHAWPGNVRELRNVVERAVYRAAAEQDDHGAVVDEIVFDPFVSPYRPENTDSAPTKAPDSDVSEASGASGASGAPSPLSGSVTQQALKPDLSVPLRQAVADLEAAYLHRAMDRARHNQRQAAELLGLTYHQFRGLWRKHAPKEQQ